MKIFFLAILFEDAILLGAENDTTLYTSDTNSIFSLPFCVLERTVCWVKFLKKIFFVVRFKRFKFFFLESSVPASNFTSVNKKKFGLSRLGNC